MSAEFPSLEEATKARSDTALRVLHDRILAAERILGNRPRRVLVSSTEYENTGLAWSPKLVLLCPWGHVEVRRLPWRRGERELWLSSFQEDRT